MNICYYLDNKKEATYFLASIKKLSFPQIYLQTTNFYYLN